MKKEVIIYTCDNCKGTKEVPKDHTPVGWGELILQVMGHVTKMNLCHECLMGIGTALGERNKP